MTRHTLSLVLLFVAALTGAAASSPTQGGPVPEVRARIDGFVKAFNSGNATEWLAWAKESFAPDLWKRESLEKHAELYKSTQKEFGTVTVGDIRRRGPGAPVRLSVTGSTGVTGVIELGLESATPFRVTSMSIDVGGGDKDDGPQIPINGRMSPAELTAALDAYLTTQAAGDAFTGSVLVARDGKPIFEKAYGFADRANRIPNTPAHRFSLGSINKSFTQTAIAQLAAKGKLAYTDTLGRWIPDYPQQQSRAATIEQLLNHAAGIADFFGEAFNRAPKGQFRSNADYFRLVSQLPATFAPGASTQYCNGCYITLGAIIERASGMPYERYVSEHIFTPAGMKDAGFPQADAIEPNISLGYTRRTSDGAIRSSVYMRGAAGSAAGSAFATTADLLAFDNALRERRLLDEPGTARVLRTNVKGTGRIMGGYGIAGGAPGTSAVLDSDGTWTVVVLTNFDPPTGERTGVAIFRALAR